MAETADSLFESYGKEIKVVGHRFSSPDGEHSTAYLELSIPYAMVNEFSKIMNKEPSAVEFWKQMNLREKLYESIDSEFKEILDFLDGDVNGSYRSYKGKEGYISLVIEESPV